MPINQSHELQGAYEKTGLDVYFDVVHGAAHGGDAVLLAGPGGARGGVSPPDDWDIGLWLRAQAQEEPEISKVC